MKYLILAPLAILIILSLLSMLGVGATPDTNFGTGKMGIGTTQNTLLYDSTGHPVCYINGSNYGEVGYLWTYERKMWIIDQFDQDTPYFIQWSNGSATLGTYQEYNVYSDQSAVDQMDENEYNYQKELMENGVSFNIWSSIGLIGIVIGITIFAGIIGIRIVSSGESDVSVQTILLGTAYVALWGIFSAIALSLIIELGTVGGIIYFILTACYTIGFIMSLGNN